MNRWSIYRSIVYVCMLVCLVLTMITFNPAWALAGGMAATFGILDVRDEAEGKRHREAHKTLDDAVTEKEKDWITEAALVDPAIAEIVAATERMEMERQAKVIAAYGDVVKEGLSKQDVAPLGPNHLGRAVIRNGRNGISTHDAYVAAEEIQNMSLEEYKAWRSQTVINHWLRTGGEFPWDTLPSEKRKWYGRKR